MNRLPKHFDWITVLERLSKGEKYTYQVLHELENMAGSWPNCACGQLCRALPRDEFTSEPEDYKLKQLGIRFFTHVEKENWCKALKTFHVIERRSRQLLIEMEHIINE